MIKPYPYQAESAGRLIKSLVKYNSAADLSDTGTGKTVVAITVAKCVGLRPFVVCPRVVIHEWKRHFDLMETEGDAINYELVLRNRWGKWRNNHKKFFEWDLPGDSLLIFDEAHRGKSYKSQTSVVMASAAKVEIPTLFASATLAESPKDMRAVGYALKLHNGGGYDSTGWAIFEAWMLNSGMKRGYFGGYEFSKAWDPVEFRGSFEDRVSRVRKEDLPEMFRNNLIQTIEFDTEVPDPVGDFPNPLVRYLEERRLTERAIVEIVCDYALELVEAGHSVPLFWNFQDTCEQAAKILKCPFINGTVKDEDRKRHIELFQSGKTRLLSCTHDTMGISVSLHDTHGDFPRIPLISPPLDARKLIQTLGRCHRSGAMSDIVQKIFFSANGPDKRIHRKVSKKVHNIESINDGDLNSD